jgi:CheY-like chemotaxis protein
MDDKKMIIVAEESSELRWLYRRWLEETGFGVTEADDGAWVLAQMEPRTPDLVLVDLHLPTMSGLEVCRRLKSDEKYCLIPVVAIAAHLDLSAKLRAAQAGVDALLFKPLSRIELVTLTRKLLGVRGIHEMDEEIQALESRLWTQLGD